MNGFLKYARGNYSNHEIPTKRIVVNLGVTKENLDECI
jgi:hypothetical protein